MNKPSWPHMALLALAVTFSACTSGQPENEQAIDKAKHSLDSSAIDERPNILLIVTDDMGFTDVGAYGGEIDTPNIDQLAADGLMMTDFHNQAVCAPTRASLLSGMDDDNAGGTMHSAPNQQGNPGYETELSPNIVSLPTILSENGYETYITGKWHLGDDEEFWPDKRGFTRNYTLIQSGASHWADQRGMFSWQKKVDYTLDGEIIEVLPDDFYSTNNYTSAMIDFIDDDKDTGKPWFGYVAYTAPHWPLHAPDDLIAAQKGNYEMGYEVLREQRVERQKSLGIIPATAKTFKRLDEVPPWDDLSDEEKANSKKDMEVYAAMIVSIDQNVGRLIDYLKQIGEYDNTIIMFISDNGAEGSNRDPGGNDTDWVFDDSFENMGRIGSHIYTGPSWAQASVGALRYFKSLASEGGTRGIGIFNYPGKTPSGQMSRAYASVVDIFPTVLDAAGIIKPDTVNGRAVQELQGRSMLPLITGNADSVHPQGTVFGYEVFGSFGLRKDNWKILRLPELSTDPGNRGRLEGTEYWGLYDLSVDPGETTDLSSSRPEKLAEMLAEWESWVERNNTILPDMSYLD